MEAPVMEGPATTPMTAPATETPPPPVEPKTSFRGKRVPVVVYRG
jgi:hypothetical protein